MKWGVPAQGELLHKGSKNPWNHAVPGVSLSKKSAEGQTFSYKRGKIEQGEKNDGKGKNGARRGGSGGYREPGAVSAI